MAANKMTSNSFTII